MSIYCICSFTYDCTHDMSVCNHDMSVCNHDISVCISAVLLIVLMLIIKEGRNEMFYLSSNSKHYLRLYGIIHMVKDHSGSVRANPLLPYGLFFLNNSKSSLICIISQTE